MSAPVGPLRRSIAEGLLEAAPTRTSAEQAKLLRRAERVSRDLEAARRAQVEARRARVEQVQAKAEREERARRQHDSTAAGIAKIAKRGDR